MIQMPKLDNIQADPNVDRRHFMRIPFDSDVYMYFTRKQGFTRIPVKVKSRLVSLSGGGMSVYVYKLDPRLLMDLEKKNNDLKVKFQLQYPFQILQSNADVVWSRDVNPFKTELGIQFADIPSEDQDKIVLNIINQIVDWNLKTGSSLI